MANTNNNTKVTRRDVLMAMANEEVIKANESYMAFITKEIEAMDKKNADRKAKSTSNNEEYISHAEEVKELLGSSEEGMTVTEIIKALDLDYSTSKATTMLKAIMSDGSIVNEKVGKKSLYRLA